MSVCFELHGFAFLVFMVSFVLKMASVIDFYLLKLRTIKKFVTSVEYMIDRRTVFSYD